MNLDKWIVYFITLFLTMNIFCQADESWISGDEENTDTDSSLLLLSDQEIYKYVTSLQINTDEGIIGGYITSIFHESIDTAIIRVLVNGQILDEFLSSKGLFRIPLNTVNYNKKIDIKITHPDFHDLDTVIAGLDSIPVILKIQMTPKYKILLKGRVFAGNIPMEGVQVKITHDTNTYELVTRGCFYDKEDYWNCLYDGMFKVELVSEKTSDSILLSLNKDGMKPFCMSMTFAEYTGELLQLRMRFANRLPQMPENGVNMKLALPFTSFYDDDWFVDLSYYRNIKKIFQNRISIGLDANIFISPVTVEHPILDSTSSSSSDTSYFSAFIGPSIKVWLLRPDKRYFSTYVGATIAYGFRNQNITIQSFIGTRIFIDMNKAISLELRYTEFDLDIVHYNFNLYGFAGTYTVSERFRKLHLNAGLQIAF